MLDKLEKIQLLTGGVLVSLLFGLFFWPGLPTPVPDFKAQKYNEDMPIFKKRLGADGQQMLETSLSKADTLAKRKMPQTQSIPRESRPVGRDRHRSRGAGQRSEKEAAWMTVHG